MWIEVRGEVYLQIIFNYFSDGGGLNIFPPISSCTLKVLIVLVFATIFAPSTTKPLFCDAYVNFVIWTSVLVHTIIIFYLHICFLPTLKVHLLGFPRLLPFCDDKNIM